MRDIIFLFFVKLSLAQFKFSPDIAIFYQLNVPQSNTLLGDAHQNGQGFGMESNFIKYNHWLFGAGFNTQLYQITDVALAGRFDNTKINSMYLMTSYEIKLNQKWTVLPTFHLGYSSFNQRRREFNRDVKKTYSNIDFNLGLNIEYNLHEGLHACLGGFYQYKKFDFKTSSAFENFFNHQVGFGFRAGLKYKIRNKIF